MWEASKPFFEWHGATALGQAISNSIWMFPAIETVHILAMAVMFGALLAMNVKLLGLGFRNQPMPLLSRTLLPFATWGVLIMLASGYMMFCSEAMKCFYNDGFKFKMTFLFLALIYQFTIYRAVVRKEGDPGRFGMIYAGVSFILWFCVGVGGRAIGFV